MTTVYINVTSNSYYSGTKALDDNVYEITIRWNTTTEKWYMDMEGLNNDVDIKGVALLPGKDLLAPFGYYELGSLWVVDSTGANENPNFDDFGDRWTVEYTPVDG